MARIAIGIALLIASTIEPASAQAPTPLYVVLETQLSSGTGPEAAACRQSQSCLGRIGGLLNDVEETIERTIERLRSALGPVILMRTQCNPLLRTGYTAPAAAALATVTFDGLEGTVLNRGLNPARSGGET
jgi:hypothetical protein